jgi:hypothetical protein
MYASNWNIVSAPLDTTTLAQIVGDPYQQILHSSDNITRLLLENYNYWFEHCSWVNTSGILPPNPNTTSSALHDLVAAFLTVEQNYLIMQDFSITVDTDGFTIITTNGRDVTEAIQWNNLEGWCQEIAERLTS